MAFASRSRAISSSESGGRFVMGTPRRIAGFGAWAGVWLALAGVYLLFVGSPGWGEAAAGLALALPPTLAMRATARGMPAGFAPRPAWLGRLARVPGKALRDCGVVLGAIVKGIATVRGMSGTFRAVPFDPGRDDPESEARRALVVAAASVAPNAYIVAIDREAKRVLYHQLVATVEPPGRGDREWPL